MTSWTRQWTIFTLLLIFGHLLLHVGFGLGSLAPDLLTITALLGARRLPVGAAVAFGFLVGVLADAFAVHGFAASGLGLAVAAGMGSLSRDFFDGDSLFFTAIYLFLGGLLSTVLGSLLAGRAAQGALGLPLEAVLTALYVSVAGSLLLLAYGEMTGPRA